MDSSGNEKSLLSPENDLLPPPTARSKNEPAAMPSLHYRRRPAERPHCHRRPAERPHHYRLLGCASSLSYSSRRSSYNDSSYNDNRYNNHDYY